MKVLVLTTWELPKSFEGLKKRNEYNEKHKQYWIERYEKYNVKNSIWTDGTGKVYSLLEFESYGDYAKFMDDEELQRKFAQWCRVVNNAKVNVLREQL